MSGGHSSLYRCENAFTFEHLGGNSELRLVPIRIVQPVDTAEPTRQDSVRDQAEERPVKRRAHVQKRQAIACPRD